MKALPEAQNRLLDLADQDSALQQLQHRRSNLDEIKQIAEVKIKWQTAASELVAADTALSDAQLVFERAEKEIEPVKARLERNKERANDGSIGDAKALQKLLEEIAHLKGRIQELEDDELEAMQVLEDAKESQKKAKENRIKIDAYIRELIKKRDTKLAQLDAQLASNESKRLQISAEIPKDLFNLYERIRARSGVAAARLVQGRCTGCQLQLTASDLHAYAAAAPDEVLRCVECDRILVRQ